jgi:hypothetical protein
LIKIEKIDKTQALRYLGFRRAPDALTLKLLDECEAKLLDAIRADAVTRVFAVSDITLSSAKLEGYSLELNGSDIAGHLKDCGAAVLLAATLGTGADRAISKLGAQDMATALIVDALANAAIEQVCDMVEEDLRAGFSSSGVRMTGRFSPGYGDFPIETQEGLLSALDAQKRIGLYAGENHMLTPLKSVTAVIGCLKDGCVAVSGVKSGCEHCRLSENCAFSPNNQQNN